MRRSYTITPANGGQLITEYVQTYPQLTVINTGQATVYLGDDSSVNPANGVPLTPGMATVWSNSPQLYAAADAATTVLITDNASNPLSANLPAAPDQWTWPLDATFGGRYTGVGGAPLAANTANVACAYQFNLTETYDQSSNQMSLVMFGPFAGTQTSIATFTINGYQAIGTVTGLTIPYGGYQLQLVPGGSGNSFKVTGPCNASLIPPPPS